MNRLLQIVVALAAVLTLSCRDAAAEERSIAFRLDTAWDSRYVSQGRDNLDGESLLGTTVEAAWAALPAGTLVLGTWYAWTPASTAYSEFNAWLEYAIEFGDLEARVYYNHLRYPQNGLLDNELGVGASCSLPLGLAVGFDWYRSFHADGSFVELSIEGEYEILPRLVLAPLAALGFNAGYIPDGHDGANNVTLALEATVPLADRVELSGYVAYNLAIGSDPSAYPGDDPLDSFSYAGVSVTLHF